MYEVKIKFSSYLSQFNFCSWKRSFNHANKYSVSIVYQNNTEIYGISFFILLFRGAILWVNVEVWCWGHPFDRFLFIAKADILFSFFFDDEYKIHYSYICQTVLFVCLEYAERCLQQRSYQKHIFFKFINIIIKLCLYRMTASPDNVFQQGVLCTTVSFVKDDD